MGVHVLDAMELLELASEVPVHNFHLLLKPDRIGGASSRLVR